MEAVRFIVYGRVQGVGFRFFVEREARRLGLKGWVRNRQDGSVECLAIGASETLEQLHRKLREGPPAARVEQVSRSPLSLSPSGMREYRSFSIEGDA
jgi:acylphosphatase